MKLPGLRQVKDFYLAPRKILGLSPYWFVFYSAIALSAGMSLVVSERTGSELFLSRWRVLVSAFLFLVSAGCGAFLGWRLEETEREWIEGQRLKGMRERLLEDWNARLVLVLYVGTISLFGGLGLLIA